MNSWNKGQDGEARAASYLESQGFRIIARNYRIPGGEIDIVAQHNDTIVFIEVKTWTSFGIEDLEYAINSRKQARIIKTAKFFLATHREYNSMALRFDVLFIGKQGIHHLASAFTERVL